MAQGRTAKKASGRVDAKKLVDLVQREIDEGASSVEEIHKAIANMPLDVLERLELFQKTVKDVRKVQEARIGAIYDVIRKVNDEVGRIAREALKGARVRAPRPARKVARKRTAHARAS